jgi:hypothetical protein
MLTSVGVEEEMELMLVSVRREVDSMLVFIVLIGVSMTASRIRIKSINISTMFI